MGPEVAPTVARRARSRLGSQHHVTRHVATWGAHPDVKPQLQQDGDGRVLSRRLEAPFGAANPEEFRDQRATSFARQLGIHLHPHYPAVHGRPIRIEAQAPRRLWATWSLGLPPNCQWPRKTRRSRRLRLPQSETASPPGSSAQNGSATQDATPGTAPTKTRPGLATWIRSSIRAPTGKRGSRPRKGWGSDNAFDAMLKPLDAEEATRTPLSPL